MSSKFDIAAKAAVGIAVTVAAIAVSVVAGGRSEEGPDGRAVGAERAVRAEEDSVLPPRPRVAGRPQRNSLSVADDSDAVLAYPKDAVDALVDAAGVPNDHVVGVPEDEVTVSLESQ